jgi:hypothetical protein
MVSTANPPEPGTVPFELRAILQETWRLFRARPGEYLAVCGTVLVLSVGTQLAQGRFIHRMASPPESRLAYFLVAFVTFVLGYVFTTWLSITQRLALLGLVRRETFLFERCLRADRFLLTSLLAAMTLVILAGMIVGVAMLPVMILAGMFGLPTPLLAPVLVAVVVSAGGIAVALVVRLSQFLYLIVDRNVGVIDSLRCSWNLTRSRTTTLVLVFALWLLINLAGILACLVGWLVSAPFASLMLAVTYLSLWATTESSEQELSPSTSRTGR